MYAERGGLGKTDLFMNNVLDKCDRPAKHQTPVR